MMTYMGTSHTICYLESFRRKLINGLKLFATIEGLFFKEEHCTDVFHISTITFKKDNCFKVFTIDMDVEKDVDYTIESIINETKIYFNLEEPKTERKPDMTCMDYSRYIVPIKNPFEIEKVIFNDPATIVFWKDGTKTVVKTQNNEYFDPEKGLAMAIAKKALGNKGNYFNVIKEHTDKHPYEGPTLEEYEKIEEAYTILRDSVPKGRRRPLKADMAVAMEEAIGYLGEVLDI